MLDMQRRDRSQCNLPSIRRESRGFVVFEIFSIQFIESFEVGTEILEIVTNSEILEIVTNFIISFACKR